MIRGYCFTNLDGYAIQDWPKEFPCSPRVGDRVESKQGRILKVVSITYAEMTDYIRNDEITYTGIRIELGKII